MKKVIRGRGGEERIDGRMTYGGDDGCDVCKK